MTKKKKSLDAIKFREPFVRSYLRRYPTPPDLSVSKLRKWDLVYMLRDCDKDEDAIALLLDKVVQLENQLYELQEMYSSFRIRYDRIISDFF